LIIGLVLLALAATSDAPQAPNLTLFSDRFYRGSTQVFSSDAPQLPEPITPQSLTLKGRWEICSEGDFKGRCMEIDRDYPVAAGLGASFTVQSLRQIASGQGASIPAASVTPGGTSIPGVASRYWPAPTYGRERILACPSGKSNLNCAHDTAEDMCRRAGYHTVRYWQLQAVDTQVYLADILCTRSNEK
jgi:hypothetical protein